MPLTKKHEAAAAPTYILILDEVDNLEVLTGPQNRGKFCQSLISVTRRLAAKTPLCRGRSTLSQAEGLSSTQALD